MSDMARPRFLNQGDQKANPDEDEVLKKVYTASMNAVDYRFLTGSSYLERIMVGLLKPKHKILGLDVAGRVKAVGKTSISFSRGTMCSC